MDRPGRGPQDRGWGSEWPGVSSTQIKRSDIKQIQMQRDNQTVEERGSAVRSGSESLRGAALYFRQATGETVSKQVNKRSKTKQPREPWRLERGARVE
jgi:hypothetical protein